MTIQSKICSAIHKLRQLNLKSKIQQIIQIAYFIQHIMQNTFANLPQQKPTRLINHVGREMIDRKTQQINTQKNIQRQPNLYLDRKSDQSSINSIQSHIKRQHNKSTNSTHTNIILNNLDNLGFFSEEAYQLLSKQDVNMGTFKKNIELEKQKIENQLQYFKKQIGHCIQDFKVSVHAQMDQIYKEYLNRYKEIKDEIQNIKNIKEDIQNDLEERKQIRQIQEKNQARKRRNIIQRVSYRQTPISRSRSRSPINRSSSPIHSQSPNANVIQALQKSNNDFKTYHILNYIAEIQKERIQTLTQRLNELFILTNYQNGFFQSNKMENLLQDIKEKVGEKLAYLYGKQYLYLRPIKSILSNNLNESKDQDTFVQQRSKIPIRKQSQKIQKENEQIQQQSFYPKYTSEANNMIRLPSKKILVYPQDQQQKKIRNQRIQTLERQIKSPTSSNNNINDYTSLTPLRLSQHQQTALFYAAPNPNIIFHPGIDITHTKKIVLCSLFLPSSMIAVGSQDGLIGIYSLIDGKQIKILIGHQASVCTLSLLNRYVKNLKVPILASGSDHECNSIILWDLKTFSMIYQFHEHRAAITSIIDLKDGINFISGSYDKKINVFSFQENKFVYNVPTNKSSVSGMIINANGNKLVSCGLDSILNIWQIVRTSQIQSWQELRNEVHQLKQFIHSNDRHERSQLQLKIGYNCPKNAVETIFLERTIQTNFMPCALVASQIDPFVIYVAAKQGFVQSINIQNGQFLNALSVGENAILQLLVIERESHPSNSVIIVDNPIILTWSYKEKIIRLTDTITKEVDEYETTNYLQFGCGVGPKSIMSLTRDGKKLLIANISHKEKSFTKTKKAII